ncbi:MAG: hypothetical protein JWO60_3079 [Frankiales bacterium]|nr:hypothetical protein [Frankiales bacterium]
MPRVPSALHALELRLVAHLRELATSTALVLLLALGAAGVAAGPPAPAGPVQATSEQLAVVELEPTPPVPAVAVSPSPRPAPVTPSPSARPAPARAPAPVKRWLPSGTGMWVHEWSRTEQGHADQVVDAALDAGLTHLYVQTGSSRKGWIGTPVLSQLLPATAGTDLKVIAWDFPKLVHPAADARRLARAAAFTRPGAPRVAAVAPDVETGSEGTHLSAAALDTYYRTLRAALPKGVAIIATVPWPSEHRVNRYPYDRTMRYADAVSPMAYWYNRPAGAVTATSMRWLKKFGKPVIPVGQGYDGRLDAPYLKADPAPDRSVQAFVDAARAGGAPAVSLWSWQTTGTLQWTVLAAAKGFPSLPGKAPATLPPLVAPSPSPVVVVSPLPTPAPVVAPEPSPSAMPEVSPNA